MPRIQRKDPKPWWKTALLGCGIGCGAVFATLVIIALVVYSKVTAVPPSVTQAPATTSSPAAPSTAPAANLPVEQQVEVIEQAVQSRQTVPVTLRVDEAQLNQMVAENAGQSGIKDPHVSLVDGNAVVTGMVDWKGRQLYLTAKLRPYMDGGQPRLRIDSAQVGSLNLPQSAVDGMQAELDRGLSQQLSQAEGVKISDIAIYNGQLVISGTTAPQ